jgi:hypothetical protein
MRHEPFTNVFCVHPALPSARATPEPGGAVIPRPTDLQSSAGSEAAHPVLTIAAFPGASEVARGTSSEWRGPGSGGRIGDFLGFAEVALDALA